MSTEPEQRIDGEGEGRLPFGRYEGRTVDWVAVVDAPYLWDLIAEEIGSPGLRAAAGRALARRMRNDGGGDGPEPPTNAPQVPPPLHVYPRDQHHGGAPPHAPPMESVGSPRHAEDRSTLHWATNASGGDVASIAPRVSPRALPWLGRVGRNRWGLALLVTAGLALISWRAYVARVEPVVPASVASSAGTRSVTRETPSDSIEVQSRVTDGATAEIAPNGAERHRRTTSQAGDGPTELPTTASVTGSVPCGARVEGAIPAESAADFLDTFQAVEFEVVKTKDTGKVTFLNSHEPYQGHFYVAVFPGDYDRFPAHPAVHFRGRCIVVQGTIERYRGAPQIVLRGPEDVRVVE